MHRCKLGGGGVRTPLIFLGGAEPPLGKQESFLPLPLARVWGKMATGQAVLLADPTEQDSQAGPGRVLEAEEYFVQGLPLARKSHQAERSFLNAQPLCFWIDHPAGKKSASERTLCLRAGLARSSYQAQNFFSEA